MQTKMDYLVNFSLIVAGFIISRIVQNIDDKKHKAECLKHIFSEINEALKLLEPRSGNLLPTIQWESCNSSGYFRLLPENKRSKINRIYDKIKNYNYEARIVAEYRDEYNRTIGEQQERALQVWRGFSDRLNTISDDLKADLELLLQELEDTRLKHWWQFWR